jgi:hypothetical protein
MLIEMTIGSRLAVPLVLLLASSGQLGAQVSAPIPVPRMQVIPLPDAKAALQDNGRELAVYHFASDLRRPFLFPIIGPSGRSLTRMGHPHDPEGHSHHNSVWISHNSVGGDDFWGDRGPGRIVHRRILAYIDSDREAAIVAENHWLGAEDRLHLVETRRIAARPLGDGEWMLVVDLWLQAPSGSTTTLGETAFGPIGVRMAKTIGVHDGGGTIRNSEGNEGEQGPNGCFRKPARWVDYSGPIANDAVEGITLMDHPQNPGHPTPFHVRADGWMGASLTLNGPIEITGEKPLRLRYGLWIHAGMPEADQINHHFSEFAAESPVDFTGTP